MSAQFLLGFTASGCLVIALFFARYHRATGDRFFALLALAFGMFAVNRGLLSFIDEASESRPLAYLIRLAAFVIIIVAIVDNDRART